MLLDHLNYGLSPEYPPYASTWTGLGGVSQKFNESGNAINSIDNDYLNNLYNETLYLCNTTGDTCICNTTELKEDMNGYNFLYCFIQSLNLIGKVSNYLDSRKIIEESRIDADNDIYDFLHDYANKHIKRACIAVFVITLILGVLGIAFLSFYYFNETDPCRILYIIIWNISMLISILAIIVSAIFGILGYVNLDSIQVINYTLSYENILNDHPKI